MMAPIKYVISIGTHCHTSFTLKEAGLKRFSCPFDWIFGYQDTIVSCLNTRFRALLDQRQYIDHADGKSLKTVEEKIRAGHRKYGDRLFNHHDPRRDDHYQYYKRCVKRFKSVATDDASHKLYVHMSVNGMAASLADAKRLSQALKQYGCTNYTLLIINHKISAIQNDAPISRVRRCQEICMASLVTQTASNGVRFGCKADNDALQHLLKSLFKYELGNEPPVSIKPEAKKGINKGVRKCSSPLYKAIRDDY